MRVVWLDGRIVPAQQACLGIDDPGVRWGEGLFETMRAEGGRVALLDWHLDRIAASAAALGLDPVPSRDAIAEAVGTVALALAPGSGRVRLTVTPRPTLLVEGTPEPPLDRAPAPVRAVSVRGAWLPGAPLAEHKTLSYAGFRRAQRTADRAGVDHALLLDAAGRLGEAATAAAFCAVDGELVCAPVSGLLPGIGRALVLGGLGAREEALSEDAWRGADEIVLANALRGAMAVVEVDGAPVGDGAPGPLARAAHALLRDALRSR